jgi:uncharacterized protein YsxB (DUF464 family)
MISTVFTSDREGRKLSLSVKGHAGHSEPGEDIICASASILAYTVAQMVKAMDSHGDFAESPTIKLDSGDAEITCVAKDDDIYAEAMHTYFIAQVGYSLLAYNYPDFVELTMFD